MGLGLRGFVGDFCLGHDVDVDMFVCWMCSRKQRWQSVDKNYSTRLNTHNRPTLSFDSVSLSRNVERPLDDRKANIVLHF
jgi:hypothetical protein